MFTKMKALTTVCPLCECEREVHYGTKDETLDIRGEGIDVSSKVYYCLEGDHYFSTSDDDEKRVQYAYREYRKRKKLLQPEDIKQIRKKYGLSQNAFAFIIGFGEKTIHRYETGAIPALSHNNILNLMKITNNFASQYVNVKEQLSERMQRKIEKRLIKLEREETQLRLPYSYSIQATSFASYYFCATADYGGIQTEVLRDYYWEEPSEEEALAA